MKRAVVLILVLTLLIPFFSFGGDKGGVAKKFKLRASVDKKRGVTSYMPKNADGRSRFFVYIVKNNNNDTYALRVRISYFAKEKLFVKKYTFTTDGEEYVLTMRGILRMQDMQLQNLPGTMRDPDSGGICEFYDIAMNPMEIETMKKISAAKKVKMRYDGTKGHKKVKIHKAEIKDIRRVLDAFDAFTKK